MDSLIKKIESISADDRRIVTNKMTWLREQSIVNKFYHYFYPHSEVYQSPLIPLFLYELEDLEMLNYFPVVLARDGAISLMKFFFENPNPSKVKTPILIHQSLKNLVPLAWKENIAFYNYDAKKIAKVDQSIDKIFLTLFSEPKHCSLEYAEKKLRQLEEKIQKGCCPEIKCYFNYKIPVGEESHDQHHTKHLFEMTTLIKEIFPENKVSYVTNDDVKSLSMNNSLLIDLNEFKFFFADCFVRHLILGQGAVELAEEVERIGYHIPYSFNHGLLISDEYGEEYKVIAKQIHQDMELLRESIEASEAKISRDSYQFEDVQLCSEELKAFTYEQLKKYPVK